jgi:hypothetical protein
MIYIDGVHMTYEALASCVMQALHKQDMTDVDRLARSTRDPLNTLAAITGKKAGFRPLGDTWADTTTSHGRLIADAAAIGRSTVRVRTRCGWEAVDLHPCAMGPEITQMPRRARPAAAEGR